MVEDGSTSLFSRAGSITSLTLDACHMLAVPYSPSEAVLGIAGPGAEVFCGALV